MSDAMVEENRKHWAVIMEPGLPPKSAYPLDSIDRMAVFFGLETGIISENMVVDMLQLPRVVVREELERVRERAENLNKTFLNEQRIWREMEERAEAIKSDPTP